MWLMFRRPHPTSARTSAAITVWILLTAFLVAISPESARGSAVAEAATTANASEEVSRPDSVSAATLARVEGHRVEDTSQRNAYTRVFSNPDGSWTSESTGASQVSRWMRAGEWQPIDTDLELGADGQLGPGLEPTLGISGR